MVQTMSERKLFGWTELPSGWFKPGENGTTGYLIEDDGKYRWWVTKNQKTVKEGKILNLAGRVKVEKIIKEASKS